MYDTYTSIAYVFEVYTLMYILSCLQWTTHTSFLYVCTSMDFHVHLSLHFCSFVLLGVCLWMHFLMWVIYLFLYQCFFIWIPRSCSFGFIVDIDSVCYLETLEWVIWRHLMSYLETLVWTLKETHPSRHSWLQTTNSMSCLNITNWIELSGDPRTSK
jgi:hypothetical protein